MRIHTRFIACVAGLVVLQGCGPAASGAPVPAPDARGSADQTGATGAVSGKTAEHQQTDDIGAMLQGKVAGLQIVRSANGDISLRIRGNTPVTDPNTGQTYGETEPLLVID